MPLEYAVFPVSLRNDGFSIDDQFTLYEHGDSITKTSRVHVRARTEDLVFYFSAGIADLLCHLEFGIIVALVKNLKSLFLALRVDTSGHMPKLNESRVNDERVKKRIPRVTPERLMTFRAVWFLRRAESPEAMED